MSQAQSIADLLKRALRARGITYAALAGRIHMSEASVKRMFSQRNFTLARLDKICAAAGIEFEELTRGFNREERLISRLTEQQEAEIVSEPVLFLIAVSVLNLLSFEEILATYRIEKTELIGLLSRLDRIGFIALMPNNRIKLLVARTFSWIPNGPIMQAFKQHAGDFFNSGFSEAGELMLVLNGRLSHASALALVERLRRVAREFSDQHIEDAALPAGERPPMTLLLACRPWRIGFMQEILRADPPAGPARRAKSAG
jgi:transcriptional regulator with XRE-family HTH domain